MLVGLGEQRQRAQGRVEELRGALVGEARERLVAGLLGVPEGAGRVGRRGTLDEVVGELARGGGVMLQRLADGDVQMCAPGHRQVAVDRLADQPVHEAQAPGRARRVLDELTHQRGVEVLQRPCARRPRHAVERRQGELAALDRRDLQQRAGGRRQGQQPPADRVAHAVGQRRACARVQWLAEAPLGGQQAHHLVGVERVAVGQLQQRAHELVRGLAAAAVQDQGAQVDVGEAGEVQAAPEARQLAVDRLDLRVATGARVVMGGDDEHRHPGEHPRHEGQQQQRGLVGGLQVVDHDEQGALGAQRAQEQRDGVEQGEARAVGLQGLGDLGQVEALAHLGGEAADPAGAGTQPPAQLVVGGARGQLADHLHPGPEGGRAAAVPAAGPDDARPGAPRLLAEGLGQARLADPGLAGEQHEAAPARGGVGQRGSQVRQLLGAAQQRQLAARKSGVRPRTDDVPHTPRIRAWA